MEPKARMGDMITESQRRELKASMAPLFAQAEAEGKHLKNVYFGEVLTPEELRDAQARGEFVQGASWWVLVDPAPYYK